MRPTIGYRTEVSHSFFPLYSMLHCVTDLTCVLPSLTPPRSAESVERYRRFARESVFSYHRLVATLWHNRSTEQEQGEGQEGLTPDNLAL